jgi:protein TonB
MFDPIQKEGVLNSGSCFTSLVASIAVHAAIASILVMVPLLFFRELPEKVISFVIPWPKINSKEIPVPPAPSGGPASEKKTGNAAPAFHAVVPSHEMVTPDKIPESIPAPVNEEFAMASIHGLPEGNGSGWGNGQSSDWIGTGLRLGPDLPPRTPPKPPQQIAAKPPIRIGFVDPSRLILKVSPIYPEIAWRSRIEGKVRLEAVIDEEGNVTRVSVVDGHPLLREASIDAVKQWKYTPTIQNGEPIPVCATIILTFRIQ